MISAYRKENKIIKESIKSGASTDTRVQTKIVVLLIVEVSLIYFFM